MNEVSEYLPWTVAKAIEALSLGDSGEFEEPWMAPIQHAAIDYLESLEQALAAAQQAQREAEADTDTWRERARIEAQHNLANGKGRMAAEREAIETSKRAHEFFKRAEAAEAALTRAREALEDALAYAKGWSASDNEARNLVKDIRAALEATQPRADGMPASGRQQSSNDA